MKENNHKVKEFWEKNKGAIKAGVICGTIGIFYGFAKGAVTGMIVADQVRQNNDDMYIDSEMTIVEEEEPTVVEETPTEQE